MGVLFTSKERIEIVKISDDHYVVMADELEMVRTPRIELNSGFRSKCYGTLAQEIEEKQNEIDTLKRRIKQYRKISRVLRLQKSKERAIRKMIEKTVEHLNVKLIKLKENRSF
ncbi:hypothetical protein TPENAI_60778 [Tenacibaculum litopenaei]|uniref:hypothetical protein n=1 Tax=Tenacibaculum litopenaei TaxID=396016 RepID=UPI0038951672